MDLLSKTNQRGLCGFLNIKFLFHRVIGMDRSSKFNIETVIEGVKNADDIAICQIEPCVAISFDRLIFNITRNSSASLSRLVSVMKLFCS